MGASIFRVGKFNNNKITISASTPSAIPGIPFNTTSFDYILCGVMNDNSSVILASRAVGKTSQGFGNGYFLVTYRVNGGALIGVAKGHQDNPLVWYQIIPNN